jgi:hypothetical protein
LIERKTIMKLFNAFLILAAMTTLSACTKKEEVAPAATEQPAPEATPAAPEAAPAAPAEGAPATPPSQ